MKPMKTILILILLCSACGDGLKTDACMYRLVYDACIARYKDLAASGMEISAVWVEDSCKSDAYDASRVLPGNIVDACRIK